MAFLQWRPSLRRLRPPPPLKRGGEGEGRDSASSSFLPGATVATILMLGALHARRLHSDRKIDEARRQGVELEFAPDAKAAFLQLLPLRFMSRTFGLIASLEIPVWARSLVYRSFSRAFHANIDEVDQKLENYVCFQDFFTRALKDGCRPIDLRPTSLVSPIDGIILRFGKVEPGGVVEQVKGFSYSLKYLLGAEPHHYGLQALEGSLHEKGGDEEIKKMIDLKGESRQTIECSSLPKRLKSQLFYCVLYLGLGDYHRVHSPVDWQIFLCRHFPGHLLPVNERAARTHRNLYIKNERVVLQGMWSQGYMALVAVGATNVGSIQVQLEPDLKTNQPVSLHLSENPSVYKYKDPLSCPSISKGQELVTFNLGSTVILVFEAPVSSTEQIGQQGPDFSFTIKQGQRIQMGQELGRW